MEPTLATCNIAYSSIVPLIAIGDSCRYSAVPALTCRPSRAANSKSKEWDHQASSAPWSLAPSAIDRGPGTPAHAALLPPGMPTLRIHHG